MFWKYAKDTMHTYSIFSNAGGDEDVTVRKSDLLLESYVRSRDGEENQLFNQPSVQTTSAKESVDFCVPGPGSLAKAIQSLSQFAHKTTGANVSWKSIPSFCSKPLATSRALNTV
ncbi:hypothetical protein R1flu_015969 [Riccia fluitans]|uniref:Uncharacterized protein n=1 Tax=Riccia fluitans TaxID=41844 RepID=A0ABD1YL03_9MARC